MKARITYFGSNGTTYSEIEDREEDEFEFGAWTAPFPNIEGNSTAFGLLEAMLQSDYCPLAFSLEEIIGIVVAEIKEEL